jgi:metallo-beta-lactamase class B
MADLPADGRQYQGTVTVTHLERSYLITTNAGNILINTGINFTMRDRGRDYHVLIANMASINPGVSVSGMPGFPGITQAYTQTLAKQKQLKPEVWVASHAGQFDLHQKYKPGDPYDPNRFVDPDGYQAKIRFYEKLFQAQLQKEGKDQ